MSNCQANWTIMHAETIRWNKCSAYFRQQNASRVNDKDARDTRVGRRKKGKIFHKNVYCSECVEIKFTQLNPANFTIATRQDGIVYLLIERRFVLNWTVISVDIKTLRATDSNTSATSNAGALGTLQLCAVRDVRVSVCVLHLHLCFYFPQYAWITWHTRSAIEPRNYTRAGLWKNANLRLCTVCAFVARTCAQNSLSTLLPTLLLPHLGGTSPFCGFMRRLLSPVSIEFA